MNVSAFGIELPLISPLQELRKVETFRSGFLKVSWEAM